MQMLPRGCPEGEPCTGSLVRSALLHQRRQPGQVPSAALEHQGSPRHEAPRPNSVSLLGQAGPLPRPPYLTSRRRRPVFNSSGKSANSAWEATQSAISPLPSPSAQPPPLHPRSSSPTATCLPFSFLRPLGPGSLVWMAIVLTMPGAHWRLSSHSPGGELLGQPLWGQGQTSVPGPDPDGGEARAAGARAGTTTASPPFP